MSLKYGIIGSGAIGGYYGGKLAKAGKDVSFLFHSDYKYVKENGLVVDSVDGNFKIKPIKAYHSTADMPKCDVVFVCLKTTNNYLLKDLLPPLLHEKTLVILIQNGLGLEADLAKNFPNLDIAGAMAFICSNKVGDGHIAHLDQGPINIGSYSCSDLNLLYKIKVDFTDSGIKCSIVDLEEGRWKKLIWNIPFNGLSVVLNTTTDHLMNNEESKSLIYDLMIEVIDGANCVGKGKFCINHSQADALLKTTAEMLPYSPSMKLDFDNKRELEIEYIYTRPIQEAQEAGFKMSRISMLEKQLFFIQKEKY